MDEEKAIPDNILQVILAGRRAGQDPLGSYTGVPEEDPKETPVQDADDL